MLPRVVRAAYPGIASYRAPAVGERHAFYWRGCSYSCVWTRCFAVPKRSQKRPGGFAGARRGGKFVNGTVGCCGGAARRASRIASDFNRIIEISAGSLAMSGQWTSRTLPCSWGRHVRPFFAPIKVLAGRRGGQAISFTIVGIGEPMPGLRLVPAACVPPMAPRRVGGSGLGRGDAAPPARTG